MKELIEFYDLDGTLVSTDVVEVPERSKSMLEQKLDLIASLAGAVDVDSVTSVADAKRAMKGLQNAMRGAKTGP